MTTSENRINDLFEHMVKKGLVSTSSLWIEKAVDQKNQRLHLDLAWSKLLVYDRLDRNVLTLKGTISGN